MLFEWSGEAMVPLPRFHNRANAEFVVHERYKMEVSEDRSQASHNHYFVTLHEAWLNLPEAVAERFPTDEHLRKHALIKAGYHDSRSFVASSKAEAVRLAAFLKPMDEYAIILVHEATVTVYTAKSQRKAAMGAKDFQASKQAVLDVIAAMILVTPAELQNAGAAA